MADVSAVHTESIARTETAGRVKDAILRPATHVWDFWPKQGEVFDDDDTRRIIYQGAFAAGKSYLGARKTIKCSLLNPPDVPSLVVEPNWLMCKRIALREMCTALDSLGLRYEINRSPGQMELTFDRPQRTIWFASGENPLGLSGTTVGAIWQDEPAIQDEETHRRLASRLRDARGGRWHLKTGTPEGFGWVHHLTQKRHRISGELLWKTIIATLWDNGSLTPDFIDSQLEDFSDPALYRMYILGEAAALSGNIYSAFSTQAHHRPIGNMATTGRIVTGWDFNVHHMSTVIGVQHGQAVHFFGEVVTRSPISSVTTEEHAQRVVDFLLSKDLVELWPPEGSNRRLQCRNGSGVVLAVPDASGRRADTRSHDTDHAILDEMGFEVRTLGKANPPVYDRIANVQQWLRRRMVAWDPEGAPLSARAVQEHSYEKGSDPPVPQKDWGPKDLQFDHFNDATGYLLCYLRMLRRRGRMRVR